MTGILFGDVEDAVIDYLNASLPEPVSDRVPEKTRSALPFVVVSRLGGPRVTRVTEQATVTVEAWASTWRAAEDLVQRARRDVHDIEGQTVKGLTFYTVREFAGPARLPDPESGLPRNTFTVSLTVRALTP